MTKRQPRGSVFLGGRALAGSEVTATKGAKARLRKWVTSLVVLFLVAGFMFAAILEGTIKKVDGDKNEIVVTGKDKKDVTVTANKDAKIILNGKKVKLADLKKDQTVKVTHEDKKASDVEAKFSKEK